jgi:hypothetical protein
MTGLREGALFRRLFLRVDNGKELRHNEICSYNMVATSKSKGGQTKVTDVELNQEVEDSLKQWYEKYLALKRRQAELREEEKLFKEFFTVLAADRFEDGTGDIEVEDDHGIRFRVKKSSVSITKLKEAGVDEQLIKDCTGSYTAMEIY